MKVKLLYDFSEFFDAGLSDIFESYEYYIESNNKKNMSEEERHKLEVLNSGMAYRDAKKLYDELYSEYHKYLGKQLTFDTEGV